MHLVNHVAYLDAGTGSLIVQALIGIVAGVAVFGRNLITKVRQKVGSVFKSKQTDDK